MNHRATQKKIKAYKRKEKDSMEFSREMKMEILEEIMNSYTPDESNQEKKRNKVLWIAQCILRDEEETLKKSESEEN